MITANQLSEDLYELFNDLRNSNVKVAVGAQMANAAGKLINAQKAQSEDLLRLKDATTKIPFFDPSAKPKK